MIALTSDPKYTSEAIEQVGKMIWNSRLSTHQRASVFMRIESYQHRNGPIEEGQQDAQLDLHCRHVLAHVLAHLVGL